MASASCPDLVGASLGNSLVRRAARPFENGAGALMTDFGAMVSG